MTDASGVAARQDVVYGCLVPGGVDASEGFNCSSNLSFMGCSLIRSAGSFFYGGVEYKASASSGIGPWEGSGRV
jgi:hypothetical protein